MRVLARSLLLGALWLVSCPFSQGQVIVRAPAADSAKLAQVEINLSTWRPGLRMAWRHLERIQTNEGVAAALRSEICLELARAGQLPQALAVLAQLNGLHRSLTEAKLAWLTTESGSSQTGRWLYDEAKKGLAFADFAGCQQIQAHLAGAASALNLSTEVATLLKVTTDPEHLAIALGNVLAASQKRPDFCLETSARLDELAAEDQEKFFVTRIYQARALLTVVSHWKSSPQGLENELAGVLCERAVRFADNKLIYAGGDLLRAAELLHESGFPEQARRVLIKARDQITAGGGFEKGPADEIELARLWKKVMDEDITAAAHERAQQRVSSLDPLLQAEGGTLLGGGLWKLGKTAEAHQAWLEVAASLAGNGNADFVHEMLAHVALEAVRCGADEQENWSEKVAALELKAGVAGKEEA